MLRSKVQGWHPLPPDLMPTPPSPSAVFTSPMTARRDASKQITRRTKTSYQEPREAACNAGSQQLSQHAQREMPSSSTSPSVPCEHLPSPSTMI